MRQKQKSLPSLILQFEQFVLEHQAQPFDTHFYLVNFALLYQYKKNNHPL
jgi:hypothetical protein